MYLYANNLLWLNSLYSIHFTLVANCTWAYCMAQKQMALRQTQLSGHCTLVMGSPLETWFPKEADPH